MMIHSLRKFIILVIDNTSMVSLKTFAMVLFFKTHPLFSEDPCAVQLVAYYDELELFNPLGSHVKQHKLGIVFTL